MCELFDVKITSLKSKLYYLTNSDSYFIIKYGNKIITNVKYYYTVEQISNYIASQEGEKIRIEKGEVKEGHLARKY